MNLPYPKVLEFLSEPVEVVFIEKPAGWLSVDPTHRSGDDFVLARWLEQELGVKIFPCHRLDRETSGVMVFALNASSHRAMNHLFELGKIKKTYEAICYGIVPAPIFKIDKAIDGKSSVTRFEVIESSSHCFNQINAMTERSGESTQFESSNQFHIIRAFPLTGRRHQIRIHLKEAGVPIIGDSKYGGLLCFKKEISRFALHAKALEIPLLSERELQKSFLTKNAKIVKVDWPEDMLDLKARLHFT